MKASPPTSCQIVQLPGVAVIDDGRLLVLNCEVELATHYTAHAPAAGQFALQQPYQTSAATVPATHQSTPQLGTNDGGCREVEDDPCVALAESRDDGGGDGGDPGALAALGGRRKRKRKTAKDPNEAQLAVRTVVN